MMSARSRVTIRPALASSRPDFNDGWWGTVGGFVSVVRHAHLSLLPGLPPASARAGRRRGQSGQSKARWKGSRQGLGGRVRLMQRYHEALEGAAQTQFRGNLINCMSCSNEMLYGALASTLTRTSTDFWPNRPGIARAASVCQRAGQRLVRRVRPSRLGHVPVRPPDGRASMPQAARSAAARSMSRTSRAPMISPCCENWSCPTGAFCGPTGTGRPTRDCLFHDPTQRRRSAEDLQPQRRAGVLGVFNARYTEAGAEGPSITGTVSPADVERLGG